MKVFLTGATGFIGYHICNHLLDAGHEVVGLYRHQKPAWQHPLLSWKKGHLEDVASLYAAMEGCKGVIHCAALAKAWHKEPGAFYVVNVTGTEHMLQAARHHRVEKFILTSTAGVLGRSLSAPLTEDDPRLEPFDNDYDLSKHMAEERVMAYAAEGRWAVVLRPSRVYGPGNGLQSSPVTDTLIRYIRNSFYMVPADGTQVSNYVYVKDVAKAHLLAFEKAASGETFIIGGENISYNRFFETFENLTNLKRYRVAVSQPLLSGAARCIIAWSRLTGKDPFITPPFARRLFQSREFSIAKAENQLGYRYQNFETGISLTLEALGYKPAAVSLSSEVSPG